MEKQGNENHSQSRPASQASNRPSSPAQNPSKDNQSQSRPASQASNRPSSPAQNPPKDNQSQSRPASQASNRPSSPAQNPPKDNQSQSQPASQASNRPSSPAQNPPKDNQSQSRPASQASNRPSSPAQNPPSDKQKPSQGSRPASQASNKSRPASQASNRPQSQVSNKPNKSQSRTSSPSVSRPPPRSPRGRSRTPRSLSASSVEEDQPEESATQDRESTPIAEKRERELPDVEEERGEGDNAVETTDKGKDGDKKGKRRRRGKKNAGRSFGVDSWPHGDNPGRMEPPHGVDDWPYGDEDGEGIGTSGRVLKRPKGVRDFSPAYEPSDAGSSVAGSDYSSVSGLSLGDWERSSLPGVDSWPYGDNPGIMVKPLDHWGKPLRNPDGSLMQKENPTGLPTYDELRDMDLDTHDDHVIKLKLEIDIDVAVEINARIHGDLTLALLM